MSDTLTYEQLKDAVDGNVVAIRSVAQLESAGGPEDKVFPPTYAEGPYARERRRLSTGETVACVLLDSVASQANRLEEALLDACDRDLIAFPLVDVDFTKDFPDIGRITSLDAPHRIADAIFRDSLLNGVPFRESPTGKDYERATVRNATRLFEICPASLIFGVWDSTSLDHGVGNKFARFITSEIVAIDVIEGVTTASRLDPLGIENVGGLYETPEGGWSRDPERAVVNNSGEPKSIRPSEVNHGNIAPNVSETGGVTMRYAQQMVVLSLAGLRRLRFPTESGENDPSRDRAAQTVLASLALASVAYLRDLGHHLRSRCTLIPMSRPTFEMVDVNGEKIVFSLDAGAIGDIFKRSVEHALTQGLKWDTDPIHLTPQGDLIGLIHASRESVQA